MMNERNSTSPPTNIGISLLLSVFLILCLFTFSAIALVQANNEWNNAQITKENRDAYYAAANEAESDLYELNSNPSGISVDLPPIKKTYRISDTRALSVEMTPASYDSGVRYEFTQFMTVNTSEWEGDDTVNVIR